MHAEPQIELRLAQAVRREQWVTFGLVAACLLTVLAVFLPTLVEMVRIWSRSETFAHCWLVLPAFLYFAWKRRALLAATAIEPFWPSAVLAALAGFVWLLGDLSSSLTPAFFGVIALVPLAVTGLLGLRWGRILAFPLAFLFFAVPFGEIFVPTLVEWTAGFTVAALRASGVPVLREGQNFVVPSGSWSVVDACSGIRYLLASMFVGALYAWQTYRSPLRRALFFAASIVVPVIANWVRAYLIVMLGHLTNNKLAGGVDHLVYGWIFFGFVMLVMFAVGARWREDQGPSSAAPQRSVTPAAGVLLFANWKRVGTMAAVLLVAVAIWPIARSALMQPQAERAIAAVPIAASSGWEPVAAPIGGWRPRLEGATSEQVFAFRKGDRQIGLFLGLFRNQRQGAELVNSVNSLVPDDKLWLRVAEAPRRADIAGRAVTVHSEQIRGSGGTIVAWQWYWLDGIATTSDAQAKFRLALDRLRRSDDTSAWVSAYVIDPPSPQAADRALAEFVRDMGSALDAALNRVALQ